MAKSILHNVDNFNPLIVFNDKITNLQLSHHVLNSDVNIVNITLIASCSLAVTKLAHWPLSSLLLCESLAESLLLLSFVLALL